MSLKKWLLAGGVLLSVVTTAAATVTPARTLRAYGPGGPHHVLAECAALFQKKQNIEIQIIKALPYNLEERLREDGDIYYGGAEYMLDKFIASNPGVIDATSIKKLHPRRIGIIVRKGNPLNIRGVEDLKNEEVDILDVKLENMRHFYGPIEESFNNIRRFEFTGQQGFNAWMESPGIDAWVTYKSWHVQLTDNSDFVEINDANALRFVPIALTHRTRNQQAATEFITFLQSDEARQIFSEHGWE